MASVSSALFIQLIPITWRHFASGTCPVSFRCQDGVPCPAMLIEGA